LKPNIYRARIQNKKKDIHSNTIKMNVDISVSAHGQSDIVFN